jgi:hypothetical protein
MSTASLVLSVDVDADPQAVFDAAVDWPGHDRWMLLTSVEATDGDGSSAGSELRAVSGFRMPGLRRLGMGRLGAGRLGLVDTMRITEWTPPLRCRVRHTGRLVRGDGEFAVAPRPDGGSVFVWSERLIVPMGPLGRAAWPLLRPIAQAALTLSLNRFARWVSTGAGASTAGRD